MTDLKKHKSIDINRKFFTVLGSVLMFGNTLLTHQWVGAVLVFAGIFLDGAYGKQKQAELLDLPDLF